MGGPDASVREISRYGDKGHISSWLPPKNPFTLRTKLIREFGPRSVDFDISNAVSHILGVGKMFLLCDKSQGFYLQLFRSQTSTLPKLILG